MALIDARELLKIAKRDEDVGADFYAALAEKTDDEKLKKRFLEIKEQELHHSKRFQAMLDELSDYVPREESFGDYENYYNSFLSKRSYMETEDAVELARNVKDDVEGIKLALSQEKNTLLFFIEMKELVPTNQHKEFVQMVIDEEREHIAELSDMLLERMG
jgi:rubrerythrin